MAIIKQLRRSGTRYRVMYRGSDGQMITRVFQNHREARIYDLQLKGRKATGNEVTNRANTITFSEYFFEWFNAPKVRGSAGHRKEQQQRFEDFVEPFVGYLKLKDVTANNIADIISKMAKQGKAEQTQLHVFNLLRSMFRDGVQRFRYLERSPVLPEDEPEVPQKEQPFLEVKQLRCLLQYAEEKEYGIAIWLQGVLGLRISEVQALKWPDVNMEEGILYVRRSYSRKDSWATKEKVFKEHPKNRKHRVLALPPDLLDLLRRKREISTSEFIAATSFRGEMLSYEHYSRMLKQYCREAKILEIATHALRRSTAGLYVSSGASKDDVAQLLDNPTAVERYYNVRERHIDKIAKVIQLRPECYTNVTREGFEAEKTEKGGDTRA